LIGLAAHRSWPLLVAWALLGLAAVLPARAEGSLVAVMTAADKERLGKYAETRARAIEEARKGGEASEVAILDDVLAGTLLPLRDADLAGDWRCRTIKLGGSLPLVVYGWFKCRISDKDGLRLEKVTGSQRTAGRFFDDGETRMIYVGALHYGDEKPVAHGADADRDQIAVVARPGPNRLRIEFPLPRYESILDIIELQRGK